MKNAFISSPLLPVFSYPAQGPGGECRLISAWLDWGWCSVDPWETSSASMRTIQSKWAVALIASVFWDDDFVWLCVCVCGCVIPHVSRNTWFTLIIWSEHGSYNPRWPICATTVNKSCCMFSQPLSFVFVQLLPFVLLSCTDRHVVCCYWLTVPANNCLFFHLVTNSGIVFSLLMCWCFQLRNPSFETCRLAAFMHELSHNVLLLDVC